MKNFLSKHECGRFTILFALGLGAFLYISLGVAKFLQIRSAMAEHASFQMPPESVTSAVVKEESWHREVRASGSVYPVQGVTLAAEADGRVSKVSFESGQVVAKDQVLIELDAAVEQADLVGAKAELARATLAVERSRQLRASNALSRDELDRAESAFSQAAAAVDSLAARVGRRKIVAPFAGRVGIRTVNIGQYVRAGDPVVPLHDLSQVYVRFAVPQNVAVRVKPGQQVTILSDAIVAGSQQGVTAAVDPQLDEKTRNVLVQALFDNKNETLRPGMFVDVTLRLDEVEKVITVPTSSISFAPYGDSMYVIETINGEQGAYLGVRQQIVQLGERRGDRVAVLSGLKPGETVATSGIFKLRGGSPVQVHNELAPEGSAQPNPENT